MPAPLIFLTALRDCFMTASIALFGLGRLVLLALRPRAALAAENLFLRKQLALFQERQVKPRRANDATRWLMAAVGAGASEQTRDLCPVIPGQCRGSAPGRPRPEASRRRDRVLQRPPYLEPETPASSARSLCGSRRRSGPGPLAMDRHAAEILPTGRCSQ